MNETSNQTVAIRNESRPFVLPDEVQLTTDMQAIIRFQQIVHANMVAKLDYGIIPGTGNKPTLLKPGAEKIVKLLGLSDDYEIVDRTEDWTRGFFRYLIKCKLATFGTCAFVAAGVGECNSMESKYRWRWVFQSQLPSNLQGDTGKVDRDKLPYRTITVNKGKPNAYDTKQYRTDNDDIYSQVNTLLKMAKKRALVDAALSAGRLSDVFTQDIEDMAIAANETPDDEPDWDAIKAAQNTASKPPVAQPAPQAPVVVEVVEAKQDKPLKRELAKITSAGALFTACYEDWNMSRTDVAKEANVANPELLKGKTAKFYQDVYVTINAVKS
jgi:hypothetical protein